MHPRTILQQKIALLLTVKLHPHYKIYRLFSVAGIAYTQRHLFNWLIENGFVSQNSEGYFCTAKATKVLEQWKNLCQSLGESDDVGL